MTIVHVVEPFATGINTFLQELVFSMPDYHHVIVHGERKDCREIDKIKAEYKDQATFIKWEHAAREIHPLKDIKAFFELKKILKRFQYNVLHLHSSKAGVLGQFIRKDSQCQTIVYTPNAASFIRTDISKRKKLFFRFIEKIIHRKNTIVVSSSESEFLEYKKLGIQSKKIKNGVTIAVKPQSKANDKEVFKVVFCGKITVQKNPFLFNQIALHFKEDKNISFTWIGNGELKDELTSKNITITGWYSKNQVYKALESSDVYLSTSSWEGFSLATIEALSFGLPLVLHDCLGNTDMVEPGVNGYLFDEKEKAIAYIKLLKNNLTKRKQISDNSIKIYDRDYNNYRCGLAYKQLYLSILEKPVNHKRNI